MTLYLIRKYIAAMLALTAMLAFFPVLFTDEAIWQAIVQAMFWSGLIAPLIIYREFKRRNLWPLYDNLRLSRYVVLGFLSAASVAISLGLRTWL